MQCLDKDDNPIPGLYAAGNLAGNFYGSIDYPLDIFGLNLGHNYTEGYVIAKEIMGKE
jgi:fumarate reductase flavoprotein subunit